MLEAWELLDITTGAELVVCPDIDWPAGTLRGAEGPMGLSWAWLVAGAPRLAISRWPVPQPGRAILLAGLHTQALRDPMLRVMRTAGQEAPLHWAGFIMVGDRD